MLRFGFTPRADRAYSEPLLDELAAAGFTGVELSAEQRADPRWAAGLERRGLTLIPPPDPDRTLDPAAQAAAGVDPVQWASGQAARLAHLRLSDRTTSGDPAWPGEGQLPLQAILRAVGPGYRGWITAAEPLTDRPGPTLEALCAELVALAAAAGLYTAPLYC